jgi:hypothetical protein
MTTSHDPRYWTSLDDSTDSQGTAPWNWLLVAPDPFDVSSAAAVATPIKVAATPTQVLYLVEPGTSTAISVSDLYQGQIGDCFLISSIGELALWHPTAISNMIHSNTNGTETVTLYTAKNGQLPTFGTTAFKAVSVLVTNTFPSDSVDNGATQDVVNGQKEIWPQVLEKAVATLDGGYAAISDGGNPMIAMEELTGQSATSLSPVSLTVAELQSFVAAGDLIAMDTSSKSDLPYGLVSDHAYMFEKLTVAGGVASLQLGNPWGMDQPSAIPLTQLSKGIVEVDIGHYG